MEKNVIEICDELKNETYNPKKHRDFYIYEPKERKISVADFRDRVVHHAIVNILEPIYEKVFIYDSYATRKDKGTHKAIIKAQDFLNKKEWFLKSDISKYFQSIETEILIEILNRKIRDKKLIKLIKKILENGSIEGKGLPIGNLTSQFFANVYLDRLDHYVKDELGLKYYIRYMDDIVVFGDNAKKLKEIKNKIEEFIKLKLNLELKESATYINKRENGLSFLGKRVFNNLIRIKPENLKRSIKHLKKREYEYFTGKISEEKLIQSSQSILGMIGKYNTKGFIKKGNYL